VVFEVVIMIGTHPPQKELFSYHINLDQRIRDDHPLRKIREVVDFDFVRAEVAHLYGYNGNESVPPESLLKMMFLLFFDDVSSERELMRIIPERLDYLWFLGYELDDPVWSSGCHRGQPMTLDRFRAVPVAAAAEERKLKVKN